MPFGLQGAPIMFLRMMDKLLDGQCWGNAWIVVWKGIWIVVWKSSAGTPKRIEGDLGGQWIYKRLKCGIIHSVSAGEVGEHDRVCEKNSVKAKFQQKNWYDQNARRREFYPGDQVLVLLPTSIVSCWHSGRGPIQLFVMWAPSTTRLTWLVKWRGREYSM